MPIIERRSTVEQRLRILIDKIYTIIYTVPRRQLGVSRKDKVTNEEVRRRRKTGMTETEHTQNQNDITTAINYDTNIAWPRTDLRDKH